jgi:plastocyanin
MSGEDAREAVRCDPAGPGWGLGVGLSPWVPMRQHRSALLASVAPLLLALTLASCGGGGETPTTPPPAGNNNNPPPGGGGSPPPGGGGGLPNSASVTVSDNQFSPGTVVLAKNGTVTWTWAGGGYGAAHNVSFTADGDSSNDKTDGTFSKTFPTTGVFAYKCTNHPPMTGTVDVR